MKKTNVIKRIIALLVLSSTVASLFGCFEPSTYEKDGVTYELVGDTYAITQINDFQTVNTHFIYIQDSVKGRNVTQIGVAQFMTSELLLRLATKNVKRIYFPWSIIRTHGNSSEWNFVGDRPLEYVISASTKTRISDYTTADHKFVIPFKYYKKLDTVNPNGYKTLNEEELACFLPANISYFFNYEDNPNEGYFFVDIIEETGKLTKPPYDPKREGYTFDGWYSDKECTTVWNFENDIVTIEFDENGERIYEEIGLYAKWVENN